MTFHSTERTHLKAVDLIGNPTPKRSKPTGIAPCAHAPRSAVWQYLYAKAPMPAPVPHALPMAPIRGVLEKIS